MFCLFRGQMLAWFNMDSDIWALRYVNTFSRWYICVYMGASLLFIIWEDVDFGIVSYICIHAFTIRVLKWQWWYASRFEIYTWHKFSFLRHFLSAFLCMQRFKKSYVRFGHWNFLSFLFWKLFWVLLVCLYK